jgi:hypothetical protein
MKARQAKASSVNRISCYKMLDETHKNRRGEAPGLLHMILRVLRSEGNNLARRVVSLSSATIGA